MNVDVLRYFKAASAAEDGAIGQDHHPNSHRALFAIQRALGHRDKLRIFGDDHNTPDGTCLRDYARLDNIARAHIAVFLKLLSSGSFHLYHLGTGRSTSVLEVIRAVETLSGHAVRIEFSPRRPGDSAIAFADRRKAWLDAASCRH